jgi:putative ABC transport system permease protein
MLRLLLSRVRATLRRSRLDDELDDELREHLALLQERFVRNGLNPSETFYAARRQFGGVTQVKEALMERSAHPGMRTVFADLRVCLQLLRRAAPHRARD